MKTKNDRCEEHGMYLYRTGFGWSCKLGCYYTDDPQKIKDGFIAQYKKELKEKINKQIKEIENIRDYPYSYKFLDTNQKKNLELECKYKIEAIKEILELLK